MSFFLPYCLDCSKDSVKTKDNKVFETYQPHLSEHFVYNLNDLTITDHSPSKRLEFIYRKSKTKQPRKPDYLQKKQSE